MIEAEESDCLVMSLVENCARRQHRAIDLLQDIGTLRGRGYNDHEIAPKIGVSVDYIRMIGTLLEKGEERLVTAVEAGILPLNMAIEIAKSSDEDVQHASDASLYRKETARKEASCCTAELLSSDGAAENKYMTAGLDDVTAPSARSPANRSYASIGRKPIEQKLLVKKAEVTQSRLLFIVEAIRELRDDENFANLLRAESLDSMPAFLEQRIADGTTI